MLLLERHSLRSEVLLLSSELAAPIPREPSASGDSSSAAPASGRFEIFGETPLLFFRSRGELYLRADPVVLRVTPEVVSTRIDSGEFTHLSFHIGKRFVLRIACPIPDGDFPAGTSLADIDFGRFVDVVLGTPERRAAIWRDGSPGGEPSSEGRIVPPLVLMIRDHYKQILLLDSELAEPVSAERVSKDDQPHRRTAGVFGTLDGSHALFFRSRGSLYLRMGPVLLRITPEVSSEHWDCGETSRFAVSLADRFLLEISYKTPDFVRLGVGALDFREKEDFDFGLFVDKILKHPEKRAKVWSPAWWGE